MTETTMNIEKNRKMLRSICESRWARKCCNYWPTAAAMRADLEARGVTISERSAELYRQGQLPSFLTIMAMINAGYWPLIKHVMDPFIQAGGIAALENELNEKRQEVMRHERELEEIRRTRRNAFPDGRPVDW